MSTYRATTPTDTFTFKEDISNFVKIQIAYKQNDVTVVKLYDNGNIPSGMEITGNTVAITLSQEETSKFEEGPAWVQIRIKRVSGKVDATPKYYIRIKDVNDEEVL